METDPAFNSRTTGPVPKLASPVWNEHAEGQEKVFYKTSEQIQAFYKIWQTNLNIRQTLSMTAAIRNPITAAARAATRSAAAPKVSNRPLQRHSAKSGLDFTALRNYVSSQAPVQSPPIPIAGPSTAPLPPTGGNAPVPQSPRTLDNYVNTANSLARQRVEDNYARMQAVDHPLPVPQRRGRTCRKCNQGPEEPVCPGRPLCKGRNPKKPNKTCSEGWD
ncbi:hypothetical protein NMY22_g10125 [Coprinellus aureogranulatus]|nr:hypothetical protein NMY22_g10125 [Coprinellus aureogranulatus]